MPLRQRAAIALRKVFRLCRPSRSPSPNPSSHPPARQHQDHPAEAGQRETEAIAGFPNVDHHRLPKLEDGNAPAVQAPEEISEDVPGEAPNAVPLPDLNLEAHQEVPLTSITQPCVDAPASTSDNKSSSTWYMAIKATVDLVVQVSDVFPPLKSAAAGVKALMDVHDAFSSNQEEFEKLSERLKILDTILESRLILPPEIRDRRDGLARAIEDIAKQLEEKTSQTNFGRIVSAKEEQREVIRLIREMSVAIEIAMLDVSISNETLILEVVDGVDWLKGHSVTELRKIPKDVSGLAQDVANLIKTEQLKRLGDVKDFGYFNKNQRGECVPGSRVALLAQLLTWAQDPKSAHAFWLSGMARTGKTAVSETFCAQLANRGLLGASFFCSIKDQDLSDVYHIIPTLAKALATTYPEFGSALSTALESQSKDPVRGMKLGEQYEALIIRPAEEAFRDRDDYILLCVDALDECKAVAALKDFLHTILSKKPKGPLKIFFTSRPEIAIKREIESSSHSSHRQSLRLHDIEKNIVRADIKLYVNHELSKIPELQEEYGERWPPPEVDRIVEQSDTLFIIAATIVRQIGDTSIDPTLRSKAYKRPADEPMDVDGEAWEACTGGLDDQAAAGGDRERLDADGAKVAAMDRGDGDLEDEEDEEDEDQQDEEELEAQIQVLAVSESN